MAADTPTILATSGGFFRGQRTTVRPGPLLDFALELSRPGRLPRICFIGTAGGDQAYWNAALHAAYYDRAVLVSCLDLFPMPNIADMAAHLSSQDLIWVMGGSTANLLALWRLHELDKILRECWLSGVVLAGISAGSLCWHVGGTTDSFGPELRAVTDGLAFLPWSNRLTTTAKSSADLSISASSPKVSWGRGTRPTMASACITGASKWRKPSPR